MSSRVALGLAGRLFIVPVPYMFYRYLSVIFSLSSEATLA